MGFSYYVDLHVIVGGEISVRQGHHIAHLVEDEVLDSIPQISEVLIHIEPEEELTRKQSTASLKWGDDLRVDPLTNEFAVVAVSWREIQVDTAGHSVTQTGYFTGLVEYRDGHWQFRDAHWSAPISSR